MCTLSQNGYGADRVGPLYVLAGPKLGKGEAVEAPSSITFADGHTELNAPDLF